MFENLYSNSCVPNICLVDRAICPLSDRFLPLDSTIYLGRTELTEHIFEL